MDRTPRNEPIASAHAAFHALANLTEQLQHQCATGEASEIMRFVADPRTGITTAVREFVNTAATWCQRLGSAESRTLADHLHGLAWQLGYTGAQLVQISEAIDDLAVVVPQDAPPWPDHPPGQAPGDGLRARAARAASPPPRRPDPHVPAPAPASGTDSTPPTPPGTRSSTR